VAIKVLLPIKPSKIKREYNILTKLNHPCVIKILDVVRCSHLRTASFVLEYFPHQDFRELYQRINIKDIKFYGKQLFEVTIDVLRLWTTSTPKESFIGISSHLMYS